MAEYILGMTFGGLALLIGAIFLIIYEVKNRSFRKMIQRIGQRAEDQINGDIKLWAKQTKNSFIPSNVYSYDNNKVFEVDSILVTDRALIVIEIKSINGGIKGDANRTNWSKILGNQHFEIGNPIIQNERHIEHIIKMTRIKVPTISLIVYSDRAEYIEVENKPSHVMVIRHARLFETLDTINEALPVRLDTDKKQTIVNAIKAYRANDRKSLSLHKNITQKGHK